MQTGDGAGLPHAITELAGELTAQIFSHTDQDDALPARIATSQFREAAATAVTTLYAKDGVLPPSSHIVFPKAHTIRVIQQKKPLDNKYFRPWLKIPTLTPWSIKLESSLVHRSSTTPLKHLYINIIGSPLSEPAAGALVSAIATAAGATLETFATTTPFPPASVEALTRSCQKLQHLELHVSTGDGFHVDPRPYLVLSLPESIISISITIIPVGSGYSLGIITAPCTAQLPPRAYPHQHFHDYLTQHSTQLQTIAQATSPLPSLKSFTISGPAMLRKSVIQAAAPNLESLHFEVSNDIHHAVYDISTLTQRFQKLQSLIITNARLTGLDALHHLQHLHTLQLSQPTDFPTYIDLHQLFPTDSSVTTSIQHMRIRARSVSSFQQLQQLKSLRSLEAAAPADEIEPSEPQQARVEALIAALPLLECLRIPTLNITSTSLWNAIAHHSRIKELSVDSIVVEHADPAPSIIILQTNSLPYITAGSIAHPIWRTPLPSGHTNSLLPNLQQLSYTSGAFKDVCYMFDGHPQLAVIIQQDSRAGSSCDGDWSKLQAGSLPELQTVHISRDSTPAPDGLLCYISRSAKLQDVKMTLEHSATSVGLQALATGACSGSIKSLQVSQPCAVSTADVQMLLGSGILANMHSLKLQLLRQPSYRERLQTLSSPAYAQEARWWRREREQEWRVLLEQVSEQLQARRAWLAEVAVEEGLGTFGFM